MDTFTNKIILKERSANQKYWSKRIKDAMRAGMSHKGDTLKKYAKIVGNVTDVANEMEEQTKGYAKEVERLSI